MIFLTIEIIKFFIFQHKSRHLKDVQIMTLEDGEDLDHSRGETFRREGGAEILELDQVNIKYVFLKNPDV